MTKAFKTLLAVLALVVAAPLLALTGSKQLTLASDFDLDGAAASVTAIHSADTITDSVSFTIDAQPDTPRPLVATLTDADSSISACTYTVVGTTGDGTVITATTALTGGSGSKTLAPAYNWSTVTSASVGVCTGEGAGDLVSLGTTTTIPPVYVLYGVGRALSSQGFWRWDAFQWSGEARTIKTSGSSTTVVSGVASSGAFTFVNVGDLITFSIPVTGEVLERKVTAKATNDSVTVDSAVNIVTPVSFQYKKRLVGPDANDAWIGVHDFDAVSFIFNVKQLSEPVDEIVQCRVLGAGGGVVQVKETSVSTVGMATQTIDLTLIGYDQCRAGLEFTSAPDDADTSTNDEIITVQFTGVRQ